MKRRFAIFAALAVLAISVVVVASVLQRFKGTLTGYQEAPPISTAASGEFKATINDSATEITYELSYRNLEGTVQQAHIHFGQPNVSGAIEVWLCSNLASPPTPPPPPTIQPCPAPPATITGTIVAANVTGQPAGPPAGQGIQPGEFAEFVKAVRSGMAYANVHTTKFPSGEIRAQINRSRGDLDDGDDDDDDVVMHDHEKP